MKQYGRYFIGPVLGDRFAEGLAALERNWVGPVLENDGIAETLKLFRAMERNAGPREKLNWRFQQALYRAYYDAYIRARLKNETIVMDTALARLKEAKTIRTVKAIAAAEVALDRIAKEPAAPELRARLGELAEALFQSIRAQLSVKKYHAIGLGRGANFDSVDVPLTDALWLRTEMTAIGKLPDEAARLARLDAILNRTDPGLGGFYDNFGDPRLRPHLDHGPGWEKDPGYYESPVTGFTVRGGEPPAIPRAWWHYIGTHYDTPLRAKYTGLDPAASYRVRIVYAFQDGRKSTALGRGWARRSRLFEQAVGAGGVRRTGQGNCGREADSDLEPGTRSRRDRSRLPGVRGVVAQAPSRSIAGDGCGASGHFLARRWRSNQSARIGISLRTHPPKCAFPFRTTNSHSTLDCVSLTIIASDWAIGTSLSWSPWMMSVGCGAFRRVG